MNSPELYDALSRLLDYPENPEQVRRDQALVGDLLGRRYPDCHLDSFAAFVASSPEAALQEEYVATFDFNPTTAPYLGHHLFGDNQKKGGYMIMLKQEYERRGYVANGCELPDHLAVVLGFLAHQARREETEEEAETRRRFIAQCVLPGVERLQAAFDERQHSPWRPLIEAVRLLCAEDCKEVPSC
ncbi:nitrate reductase molybdenum cofactor assembly chaperone [Trichlorobacter ammonificans]|uniref:Nitrate reductase molybdenum cofactor assembly chaperone n=1 Tax=Trichlorobacter ammonificans TaxID=2916410 RepID=A0ABM9DAW0_9BACT|nr:nitrate reductase molybdenum cofactor assembly chaperone [Trichlorobacter ammonificans]CAH2031495.1 Nitrate reductase molybdenum cofactor assembly chaperone [Trichlorobacter ammonificans]